MPAKKKYTKAQRNKVLRLYALNRVEAGTRGNGTKFNSRGKKTLREISAETGVEINSVAKIVKGER